MNIHPAGRLFPIVVVFLAACTSMAARPEYPVTHLFDHHWVTTANPGEQQTVTTIVQELAEYDVVVFGELHGHPGVHLAQMQLMQQMHQHRSDLGLSLEQFERDTQAVLDDYMESRIGEQTLRDNARAWANYTSSYRPLVEYAKQHQLPVIAANAPKNAVVCVGKKGLEILDAMPEKDRRHIASEIDVSDGAYKKQYMEFIAGNSSHGGGSGDEAGAAMQAMANRSFAAQVVRDETMAESIGRHIQDHPDQQLLHITGHFHSDSFLGTVERLSSRMPELKIAVISPVSVSEDKPAWSKDDLESGTVLLLVGKLPREFVQHDNEVQRSRAILKQRTGTECKIQAQ